MSPIPARECDSSSLKHSGLQWVRRISGTEGLLLGRKGVGGSRKSRWQFRRYCEGFDRCCAVRWRGSVTVLQWIPHRAVPSDRGIVSRRRKAIQCTFADLRRRGYRRRGGPSTVSRPRRPPSQDPDHLGKPARLRARKSLCEDPTRRALAAPDRQNRQAGHLPSHLPLRLRNPLLTLFKRGQSPF